MVKEAGASGQRIALAHGPAKLKCRLRAYKSLAVRGSPRGIAYSANGSTQSHGKAQE